MTFDGELLASYRALLQHTDLQKAYQEFVRLFRYLRVQLEKQLPGYTFQGGIVENAMDYAYFQFTDPRLRAAGLKIVIVFVHRDFQLEVWLSGVNRKAQCAWAEKLGAGAPPFLPFPGPGPHRLHPPGAGGGGALPRPSRPGRLAGPATAAAGQPESLFVKRKPGRRQRRLPGFSL